MFFNIAKKFVLPISLISISLFLLNENIKLDAVDSTHRTILFLLFSGFASLATKIVDIFYFDGFLANKKNEQIPALFKNIVFMMIWVLLLGTWFLSTNEYLESFAGFLATSSVLIAIVGFAVRNLLADFFAGITLGIERPFNIGEWIEISAGQVGQVLEMNWRSTKIVTRNNIVINIPNAELSSLTFHNYNRPSSEFRVEFSIVLGYEIETNQVERILLASANSVDEIRKSLKLADVKIKSFCERGVEWNLRFWIDDYAKKDNLLYEVQKNLLQNLRFLNITPPPEIISISKSKQKKPEENEVILLLYGVDIFKDLASSEIELLAHNAKKILFSAKQKVVNQGESGDSLFLIAEGLLKVSLKDEKNSMFEVATLRAGMFFGEMSILTGEPRSASVEAILDSIVYEIPKFALAEVLKQNPSYTVKLLSATLATRQLSNAKLLEKAEDKTIEQVKSGYLNKIKSFFNLNLSK